MDGRRDPEGEPQRTVASSLAAPEETLEVPLHPGLALEPIASEHRHMRHRFKPLWFAWKAGVFRVLDGATWLASLAAYLVGVGPVALVLRRTRWQRLDRSMGDEGARNGWTELPRASRAAADLDESQRPF